MYPAMKAFVDANAANVPGYIWPADHGFGDWCPPVLRPGRQRGPRQPGRRRLHERGVAGQYGPVLSAGVRPGPAPRRRSGSPPTRLTTRRSRPPSRAAVQRGLPQRRAQWLRRRTSGPTSILPLAFGMVPAADVQTVGEQLVHTIATTDGGHLDCRDPRHPLPHGGALAPHRRAECRDQCPEPDDLPRFRLRGSAQGATTENCEELELTPRAMASARPRDVQRHRRIALTPSLGGIKPDGRQDYATLSIAPQVPPGLRHASPPPASIPCGARWCRRRRMPGHYLGRAAA